MRCVCVVFNTSVFVYPRNRMSFSSTFLSDVSVAPSARPLWLGGLLAAVLLVGCGQGNKDAVAVAPPLAQVGVVTVALGDVGLMTELPGRLEASRVAQVRARVAGILQKRLFREGSDVTAGEALFTIDSAPYAAAYASAQASLARAQANLEQATSLAQRYQPLVKANAVSKQEFANAEAAQKQAEADVAVGKAALQTAKITLDYAAVTAPISGRIGRALVTEGALVGQGDFTQLAVIQQINPMYINFTQSAAEVLKLRKALEAGQLKRASGDEAVKVRLVLEDGSAYAQAGRLLFSDLSVDQATGQITLRAEVPNPKGLLLPGLYVRVRLEQAQATNAMLLPQQAVTRTAQGDTVMVVASDGKVAPRKIKVGESQGNRWVILDGLQAGEQVMVDGFQKLRGPAPVKPVPWTDSAAAATQAAPSASAAKN
jgi:membrane fusion protein (multidrug efflux system)